MLAIKQNKKNWSLNTDQELIYFKNNYKAVIIIAINSYCDDRKYTYTK